MDITRIMFTSMVDGYIECARWSSSDDDVEILDGYEFSDGMVSDAYKDCDIFIKETKTLLEDYLEAGNTMEQFGHDFWLTRNCHGAGFWDRGLGDLGDKLADVAEFKGDRSVFINDENKLEFL